jgi:DNA-binding NarL/FixJ family response regulator
MVVAMREVVGVDGAACVVISTERVADEWSCVVSARSWARLRDARPGADVKLLRARPEGIADPRRARERSAGWILELGVVDLSTVRRAVADPRAPTVVMTRDSSSLLDLVRCGVRVCIDASSDGRDVAVALMAATLGLSVWPPAIGDRLRAVVDAESDAGPADEQLTAREREVLSLFARGLSYDDAARVLGLSANTVRTYVRHVYAKLQVVSKTEAVLVARRRGWIDTL